MKIRILGAILLFCGVTYGFNAYMAKTTKPVVFEFGRPGEIEDPERVASRGRELLLALAMTVGGLVLLAVSNLAGATPPEWMQSRSARRSSTKPPRQDR